MTIEQIFQTIVKTLEAVRTGKGNNDLHETGHYSIFEAKFGDYVSVCNKACTVELYAIFTEEEMKMFLKKAKR